MLRQFLLFNLAVFKFACSLIVTTLKCNSVWPRCKMDALKFSRREWGAVRLFAQQLLGNWKFLENTISRLIVSAWLHAAVVQISCSVCSLLLSKWRFPLYSPKRESEFVAIRPDFGRSSNWFLCRCCTNMSSLLNKRQFPQFYSSPGEVDFLSWN
jgi:hypothetical protein